jgi:L-asparaginase
MKNSSDNIHFVITGGTIDSVYDGFSDSVKPRKHSIVPSLVKNLRLFIEVAFTEVYMKDSRSLTSEDMVNVLATIEKSPHKRIIVTHGTYTMPDTARYLEANLKRKDQTIIFTGSYIPIDGFAPSDGTFNLGYAISQVQVLPVGIYVCMNGKVFEPSEIRKALYEGRFESIYTK